MSRRSDPNAVSPRPTASFYCRVAEQSAISSLLRRSDLSGDCTSAIVDMADRPRRRRCDRVFAKFEKKCLSGFVIAVAIDANASAMSLRQLTLWPCEARGRAESVCNCYELTLFHALAVEIRATFTAARLDIANRVD